MVERIWSGLKKAPLGPMPFASASAGRVSEGTAARPNRRTRFSSDIAKRRAWSSNSDTLQESSQLVGGSTPAISKWDAL